jgi:hypothetical protein
VAEPENHLTYRGYDLEEKTLMVGWQIATTRNGAFIRNSNIAPQLSEALREARAYVDDLIKAAEAAGFPP